MYGVVGSYSFNTDTGCGCVMKTYDIYFPVVKSSDPIVLLSRCSNTDECLQS